MKEKINRVLFDSGADFKDIDSSCLVKFCEEKLNFLSFELDEYYNIYKEVKKTCRFTVRFKITNLDCSEVIKKLSSRLGKNTGRNVGPGLGRVATNLSFASGMSLARSFRVLGRAMVSAGEAARNTSTAMEELNSAMTNNK